MIKSITITNHLDESLTLELTNPEKSGFVVRFIDGLGPPKANIETTEMSLMDGALYNSARAQSRNIVFSLGFLFSIVAEGEISNIENTRQKTYKYFPLKKRIKLLIETDNRLCEVYGYVESNTPDIFNKDTGTVISIICPDSYLLSTEINTVRFANVEARFEFPFSNESTTLGLLEFSEIIGYDTNTIYYQGDAEIGVVMTIHALDIVEDITIYKLEPEPVENIKIITNRIIALTGQPFHEGDDIIISTVKGNKYAILLRDGLVTNILNCLDKYPDWFQLTRGDNIFTYTADDGEIYLQFKIENQIAYEGI